MSTPSAAAIALWEWLENRITAGVSFSSKSYRDEEIDAINRALQKAVHDERARCAQIVRDELPGSPWLMAHVLAAIERGEE